MDGRSGAEAERSAVGADGGVGLQGDLPVDGVVSGEVAQGAGVRETLTIEEQGLAGDRDTTLQYHRTPVGHRRGGRGRTQARSVRHGERAAGDRDRAFVTDIGAGKKQGPVTGLGQGARAADQTIQREGRAGDDVDRAAAGSDGERTIRTGGESGVGAQDAAGTEAQGVGSGGVAEMVARTDAEDTRVDDRLAGISVGSGESPDSRTLLDDGA